jgi:AcrR family transcriptional regulator
MRSDIKAVATALLNKHGCRGMSFGDIAAVLATTRANIHYHFGNKDALIDEVLDDYVTCTLETFRAIWTAPETSLQEKIAETAAFNRERYVKFNTEEHGRPWSLIARMRGDSDALSAGSIATLRRFAAELAIDVSEGVRLAIQNGELAADAPVPIIVLQFVSMVNSAGPITQDAGSFERLEELYAAFLETVTAAYGRHRTPARNVVARRAGSP